MIETKFSFWMRNVDAFLFGTLTNLYVCVHHMALLLEARNLLHRLFFFWCVWVGGKFPPLRVYSQSKIMYNYLFAWKFLFWNARAISSRPKLYADIIRALTFEVKLDCQNDVGKPVSREASGLCRIFVLGMWVWKWEEIFYLYF